MPKRHTTLKYRDPEELGRLRLRLEQRGRLSIRGAAKLLHLHPQTLHTHAKWGWIQTVQIGERQFVLKEELDRYIHEGPLPPSKLSPKGSLPDEPPGRPVPIDPRDSEQT